MAVDHQLALMFYHFGHYGNAASLHRVADWAGIWKATVLTATHHVTIAVLQSSFKDQVICMLTPEEKEEAKQWVEQHSQCTAWRDGWCFWMGHLFPSPFAHSGTGKATLTENVNTPLTYRYESLN